MKQSELLRKSIDHLRENGWTKGSMVTRDHRHCMAGAIRCLAIDEFGSPELMAAPVEGDKWGVNKIWLTLEDVIEELTEGAQNQITAYNDVNAQGADDVIAVMEKAAARLEEQGD